MSSLDSATAGATVPAEASPDDALLARAMQAADGDTAAVVDVLRAAAGPVHRAVVTVLAPGHPELEDVVQQALVGFVQAVPRFRGECHPIYYACRIAIRIAVAARRRSTVLAAQRAEIGGTLGLLAGPSECPATLSGASRRRALVRELLDELPAYLAETVALRIMLGYSLVEVAEITGAPVNTVRSRLRIAKTALRERIARDPLLVDELGQA
ncbi:MAG: sigma-70 family RNA polymerase sigma factor [Polyangiaceae bacterium]|nr:sigma-70 family RNA polymerase sigma factor [Polyangiaceae bacterium]